MAGSFLLVLHSHLPYVRGAGRWPHGEEWVHEAILGTYLPLLVTLHDLRDAGSRSRLTVGLTPTLLEQLAHPEIRGRSVEYIDDQIDRAERDVRDLTGARRELAEFYRSSYQRLRAAYVQRFRGDVVGAFADLVRSGHVQILTSAATHGYLPLLDEASVEAQLRVGVATTRRLVGIEPTGIWLPECAYRPGLERALERHGLTHFFTDAPLLAGAETRAPTRPFAVDPRKRVSGGMARAGLAPATSDVSHAYLVADSAVAAIARHPEISGQVWSASLGYPGDPAYREFHRKDDRTGLRYWRVTALEVDLADKAGYDVGLAAARVREHADHFVARVRAEIAAAEARSGEGAIVATTFDSELFGHWWYEGTDWISLVLRGLGDVSATAEEQLERHPPRAHATLREGSWGTDSDHSTWLNVETAPLWSELAGMSRALVALRTTPPKGALRARAARQAVRELLLAQSSDWPFLVTTGQATEYARSRFRSHADRFARAVMIARSGSEKDDVELSSLERIDDPFPDIAL